MCKDCVISYLSSKLADAKSKLEAPQATSIELRLERVQACNQKVIQSPARSFPKVLTFPGSSVDSAKSFAVNLRLIHLILENLKSNKVATVRDLYYQDVALFRTQNVVYRSIEQLCRCFHLARSMLNVQPSPNGLIAGDLTIALEKGEILDIKRSNGSTLIPVSNIISASAIRAPEYILVVEKEAVFSYLQTELPEGIIITGKGFPDRATRNLLNALSISYPQAPIFGLVDSDPHGILILRNYELGSELSSEIPFQIDIQYLGISLLDYTEGLVPSTHNDMRVSMSTLKKNWIHQPKYRQFKEELQRGLFMGLKGEMNLIDQEKSSCLSRYVREKIASRKAASKEDKIMGVKEASRPKLISYIESISDVDKASRDRSENEDIFTNTKVVYSHPKILSSAIKRQKTDRRH